MNYVRAALAIWMVCGFVMAAWFYLWDRNADTKLQPQERLKEWEKCAVMALIFLSGPMPLFAMIFAGGSKSADDAN